MKNTTVSPNAQVLNSPLNRGPQIVSIDFDEDNQDVVCIHGNGTVLGVGVDEGSPLPTLAQLAIALPHYVGGVFIYLTSEELRALATAASFAADSIDKLDVSKELVVTIN